MLIIDNISFNNGKNIIKDFSLCCKNGNFVIHGKNGAGKTTFLKLLTAIIKLDNGKVTVNNYNIEDYYNSYCNLFEYVSHKPNLKLYLTVLENIEIWAKLKGSEELIPSAIQYFGLEKYIDTPCGELSSGWQRRVSLARLIACNSYIWFLDEPFINLDEDTKIILKNLITIKSDQGIVFTTASNDVGLMPKSQNIYIEDYQK